MVWVRSVSFEPDISSVPGYQSLRGQRAARSRPGQHGLPSAATAAPAHSLTKHPDYTDRGKGESAEGQPPRMAARQGRRSYGGRSVAVVASKGDGHNLRPIQQVCGSIEG